MIMRTFLLSYLLNSIWQVPLIYVAARLCARIISPLGSLALHRLWVAALECQVLLPACALSGLPLLRRLVDWVSPNKGGLVTVQVLYGPAASAPQGFVLPQQIATLLLAVYLLVTCYFGARLLWRLARTNQLARNAKPLPSAGLRLATSSSVISPVTIGIRRSTLILPAAFLDEASSLEVQAVFAHEGAHIRRRDYLKNLIYQVVSLPIACHPAVWLTLTRVTETREMVCDEIAAAQLPGSSRAYARALLRLATVLLHAPASANLHAIGVLDANIFERRIMNLIQNRPVPARGRSVAALAVCGAIALATSASALALRVNIGQPVPATLAQDAGQVKIGAGVMAGQVLTKKSPVYPADAKATHDTLDGSVILSAVIGKDGSIESLKVLKSLRADYDASALEAVKEWKYKPYLLNGEPTAVETTITVNYSMDHSQH